MSKENPLVRLKDAVLGNVFDYRGYLLGRVLTIIDASIADPEQRKGIKDLINNAFWDREYFTESIRKWIWEFGKKHAPQVMPGITESDEEIFLGTGKLANVATPQQIFFE